MTNGNIASWPNLPAGAPAVAARQYRTGWAVATDPVYGYVSGTDLGPAINAAIAAMPTGGNVPGGTIVIPPGDWTLSVPIALKTGIRLIGSGRQATRLVSAVGVFRWASTIHSVHISGMHIRSTAGHVFTPGGADAGIYTTTIQDCHIYVSDPAASIMHHDSALDYDRVTFRDCYLMRANNATVPAFYIRNTIGAANENVWDNCWVDTGGGAGGGLSTTHFFHLENASASNYAYDNVFRNLIGERTQAGLLNLLSANNTLIENCVAWDAETNYVRDWIRIARSATGPGLPSKHTIIRGGGRRGGTLDSGVYDINSVPTESTHVLVDSFNHSSSGTRINFAAADRVMILNTNTGAYTGQPTNARSLIGMTPHLQSGAFIGGDADTDGTNGLNFGADVNLFRGGGNQLRTNDNLYADGLVRGSSQAGGVVDIGAVGPGAQAGVRLGGATLWLRGTGSPEGAVVAGVGSMFTRTDGGANTTLYVKESGAGNTGWVAK